MFLSQIRGDITRSNAARLIATGKVLVNNELISKPAHKVKSGDVVIATKEPPQPSTALPEDIPLDIIYEDESIVVVNKQANMVVHPAAGNYTGTLVNALLFHCNDLSGIGGVMRPGIVHRLDKGTSGVIVAAKNDKAHNSLADQFKGRLVLKRYMALVFGHMPGENGMISSDIGRDMKNRKKISSNSTRKREALTMYKVTKYFRGLCLVQLTPKTGRTHQIRVHLSESGHPIAGDDLYGANGKLTSISDTMLRKRLRELDRFLLHASYLKLVHPETNEYVEFSVDIPWDFADILRLLDTGENNQK